VEIEQVRIQNFRSIRDMKVALGDLTILIGPNGIGKTTVLEALDLFTSRRTSLSDGDFLSTSKKIRITLYIRVGGHYVPRRFVHNGVVELQRSFRRSSSSADPMWLRAAAMCNRDFDRIRGTDNADGRKAEIKNVLKEYPDFPRYTTRERWLVEFAEYEHRLSHDAKHQDKYYRRFVPVSEDDISLPSMLEVVMVPSAWDMAAGGEDGFDPHLSKLVQLAIHSAQKNDVGLKQISDARDDAYAKYAKSVEGTIAKLNSRLKYHSERYMTGAEFTIGQGHTGPPPADPGATVRMRDRDFMAPIGRAGSGAQRVYLLSLLDAIASILKEGREAGVGQEGAFPIRLIAIDEPELYQHPQRQQRILRSLINIVEGDPAVRIVCSTHSPYFVRLKRIHSLRLLQRAKRGRVLSVTPGRLAKILLPKKKIGADGGMGELAKWLDMSATRWVTEGFFARLVVITEGEGDRNILLATASAIGADLGRHEITVVPVTGNENVERFARLYGEFKIPVYLVWDRDGRWDEAKGEACGEDMRRANVASGGEFRGSLRETTIEERFACVKDNLTATLSRDLRGCGEALEGNEEYGRLLQAVEQDEASTRQKARRCPGCGEAQKTARVKPTYGAQKAILNNRLAVMEMLGAIRARDPEALEALTVAKIVREVERAGRAAASDILRAGYDKGSRALQIEFRDGRAHEYHGVPEEVYAGLLDAASRDEYFHMRIHGKYAQTGA